MSLELAHNSLVREGEEGIDFEELAADNATFYHDVWGCDKHVSRSILMTWRAVSFLGFAVG